MEILQSFSSNERSREGMKIFIGGISPEEIEIHFYHGILVLLCADSETLLVYCNHVIYRLSFQPKFQEKKKKKVSQWI